MPKYDFKFRSMGCPAHVVIHAPSLRLARQACSVVRKFLSEFESKYSRYHPASELSAINASAGQGRISVDDQTTAMLNFAQTAYEMSDGLFDISSGVFRKIWDFKQGIVPKQAKIDELLNVVGWSKVEWKPPYLTLPEGMQLDFGGFAKEYAADVCVSLLEEQYQALYGLISLGGDISLFGSIKTPLAVAVDVPVSRQRKLTLNLTEGAVATSGDGARYFEHEGKRYCHIINPKTGWPVEPLKSVTVVAPQCVLAGAMTTIAMLKGEESGKQWLAAQPLPYAWFDQREDEGGTLLANANYSSSAKSNSQSKSLST